MIHICLFIFINLVTISQTYADIIAEDVSGQVFVRAPLSLRWYAVETDMILDAGMLIQTRQNSEVTLRFDGDAILRNIQGTNARLTLSTPTVLRIGPGIIRSISKTRKYMQALPNLGAFSFLVTQGKQANKEAHLAGWG
ncbi:MAG: hypothetical protein OXT67_06125, partial [Zetaproteobacteria bacterium]|nr:hypothetical protein [Zetaproteobacteria bacterium]